MEEKAGYRFSISMNEGIVEIVIAGEVTKDTIGTLHTEVITIISEKRAKAVLCDVRELKGYTDDVASAFFRVRSIPPDVQKLPAAIVEQSKNQDFISFYETTSANAGQSVKWFTDIEAAKTWVKSRI